jgi:hypothetical protein
MFPVLQLDQSLRQFQMWVAHPVLPVFATEFVSRRF